MFGWWKSYVSSNKNLRCEIMTSQDHFIDWGKTQDDHPWTFEKEIVAMASSIDIVVFAFFPYRTVCWEMRHTAHVSNQVVKKPSQNPTKTPILEGIGVFLGVKKFVHQLPKLPKSDNKPTRGKIFWPTPTQPGKSWGKSWGIIESPPNNRVFSQPTNRGRPKNPSLQLVKLQIFTQARSQFFQLSKFLCPQRCRSVGGGLGEDVVVGWEATEKLRLVFI